MRPRSLALAALLVVLMGCSGQRVVESGGHTIYVHGGSPLPRGGMEALVEGTLGLHDGCVVLAWQDEDLWYPVVWPADTSMASSDPFVIRLPSGVEVTVGDEVSGGGGYLSPADVEADLPDRCVPETSEIAVFNPDADPSRG